MFKNPTISVGMIGWFVRGAMYLARTIEDAVQAGWSLFASFIWLLSLTGLGTTESGIDCRVIGVVTITSAFVSVASELAVAIFASEAPISLAVFLLRASQLSPPAQKLVISAVRAAMDFGFPGRGGGQAIRHGCYV